VERCGGREELSAGGRVAASADDCGRNGGAGIGWAETKCEETLEAVERYTNAGLHAARCDVLQPAWYHLMGITRPMRQALGLRSAAFNRRSRENA
jgi:hypothetical protein